MTTSNLANWGLETIRTGRIGDGENRAKATLKQTIRWGRYAEAAHLPAIPVDAYPPIQQGPRRRLVNPAGPSAAPVRFTRPTGGPPPNLLRQKAYATFDEVLPRPRADISEAIDADDPFLAALEAAEFDDEPFTAEDRAAADEGWREYQRGESSSLDEVRRRLLGDADAKRCAAV